MNSAPNPNLNLALALDPTVNPTVNAPLKTTVNFDPIARAYRWLEYLTFGPMLMRCRCQYLPQLANCRRALVLGDGDGRFLARLLAAAPALTADVVDSSEAMLRLLGHRIAAANANHRVTIHHTDALAVRMPMHQYDLVVAHFFLDCFDDRDVTALIHRIAPGLSKGALWVVSEFAVPVSSGWRRLRSPAFRILIRLLYLLFGLATGLPVRSLPDHSSPMRARQFRIKARHSRLGGLLLSELWMFDSAPAAACHDQHSDDQHNDDRHSS